VPPPAPALLSKAAPAKINLTLRVVGRRADGYHELDSLVAFARLGDSLTLQPRAPLGLDVRGPFAGEAGRTADNLVLKAARELERRVDNLVLGRFTLDKRLPVAAGLGGGSADAAAGLRLLAAANGLAADDARLLEAARATGADVPVCLDPWPRVMRGIGEELSAPIRLPPLPAVLINPGVPLATKDVFAAYAAGAPAAAPGPALDFTAARLDTLRAAFDALAGGTNDLEPAAVSLCPAVAAVLAALARSKGCRLARMSGSGATCFGLYDSERAADAAARSLRAAQRDWWVKASMLG
jgi:4-diphosphocytidyl-2-C-methyl-D-erythritol kinase